MTTKHQVNLPDNNLSRLDVPNNEQRVYGQVKWFNSVRGYGFITALSGDYKNIDIFVYQNNLLTHGSNNVYRTLHSGEYVEFIVTTIDNDEQDKVHATSVTGINQYPLMCETNPYKNSYRKKKTKK